VIVVIAKVHKAKLSRVRERRWSKAEYYRLGELGFFLGQRVELIEGKLMVMSPQNAPHAGLVDKVQERLRNTFDRSYRVRVQLPLDLGTITEPEPDIVVVLGTVDQFMTAHPTSASLIVEVSDTTLSYDRNHKGSLYARVGIADYWIVNVNANLLEVHRDPIVDATTPFGWRYSSIQVLQVGASVQPVALPGVDIPVAELLQ
jgi:Uma2 family endonuclease